MLDTEFGDGRGFLEFWNSWVSRGSHSAACTLQYVAITAAAPGLATVLQVLDGFPALAAHRDDLQRQWRGVRRGFQRLVFDAFRVQLTLCAGPLQAMLREQQFQADLVRIEPRGPSTPAALPSVRSTAFWDGWCLKALVRLCHAGTSLQLRAHAPALKADLERAGFVFQADGRAGCMFEAEGGPVPAPMGPMRAADAGSAWARYRPPWDERRTRHAWRRPAPCPTHAVVVGAGLSGALAAAALARRGWQVTVLDAAAQPAAGASGLPVGLVAPLLSRDDNIRSQLVRAGMRATFALCHALLEAGQDWEPTGVLELRLPDGGHAPEKPFDAGPGMSYTDPGAASAGMHRLAHFANAIQHEQAGWIKPAELVRACLRQGGVTFRGLRSAHALVRHGDDWQVLDADGAELAQAPQVVLACTQDCARLLDSALRDAAAPRRDLLGHAACDAEMGASLAAQRAVPHATRLSAMAAVSGQVSWGWQCGPDAAAFPPLPVNGNGSFVPHVPIGARRAWFAGATYTAGAVREIDPAAGHQENLQRLSELLPAAAAALRGRLADGSVHAWAGTRFTTPDRLPIAGNCPDPRLSGLWVSTAMGSRGLTFATLAAELIAARLAAEPLPVEARLARSLAVARG